jgi:hypothetical protein
LISILLFDELRRIVAEVSADQLQQLEKTLKRVGRHSEAPSLNEERANESVQDART